MAASLPDLLLTAEKAPADSARARGQAGWARSLRLWLPAGFLILLAAACFLWPRSTRCPSRWAAAS